MLLNIRRQSVLLAVAFAATVVFSRASHAQYQVPVPDATFEEAAPGTVVSTLAGTVTGTEEGISGSATAAGNLVVATSSSGTVCCGYVQTYASVDFNVGVNVGVNGVFGASIPIIVTASGLTNATGTDAYVFTYVTAPAQSITQLSGSDYWESLSCPANNCGIPANQYPVGGTGSFEFDVPAGSYFDILMVAEGDLNSGSLMAQADPIVEIDPAFLATLSDPTAYSLGFSANITPTPVPIPAAAWLLLSALGGVGLLGRRRVAS